jgi:uncharacterized protein (TIGR02266 family)
VVIHPPAHPANGEEDVFVVDDMKTMRDLVSLQLRQLGCRPEAFESAERCLEALSERQPKLILMDLGMGPMRGDECCQKIKENEGLSRIPIIMLTGADLAHEVMRSWRAGADDFLPKPVRLPQLASKVQALRTAALGAASSDRREPSSQKLIYVENRSFYRASVGGALEHAGFQILYCNDGAEALQSLTDCGEDIDLLICDLGALGAQALEEARQLRARAPQQKPMLLTTAVDQPPAVQKAVLQLTGHELVNKRVLPTEAILAQINSLLRRVTLDIRSQERVPFFSVVGFRFGPGDEWLSGFAYNISRGGIFIRTLTPLPPLSSVEMKVRFVTEDVCCEGAVAWANAFNSRSAFSYPLGMGIRFSGLDAESESMVTKLVQSGGSNPLAP